MVHRTVLDNGLRLLSEEVAGMPTVTVGVWVESGSRDESRHHNGISHFLEHLFFKGTARRTALQIAQEIDAIGGALDAFTGKEYTCYYTRTLSEHLPLALDLLTDILLYSSFPAEEIERERSVIRQEIAQSEDQPDELIGDLFHLDFCWATVNTTTAPSASLSAWLAELPIRRCLKRLDRSCRA
jgi:predicted Zn-dependent peptidase